MDYLLSIALVLVDLLYTLYCATSMSQHRVDPQLCLISSSDLAGLCFLLTDILPAMKYELFGSVSCAMEDLPSYMSELSTVCCCGNSITPVL